MSPSAPYFQLSSSGNLGSLEIEFAKTSELFVFFDCESSCEWEYPLLSLLHGMRALAVAAETYVRINDKGIMCIQHQVMESRLSLRFAAGDTCLDLLCAVRLGCCDVWKEVLCRVPHGPDLGRRGFRRERRLAELKPRLHLCFYLCERPVPCGHRILYQIIRLSPPSAKWPLPPCLATGGKA